MSIKFAITEVVNSLPEKTYNELKKKITSMSNRINVREFENSNLFMLFNNYTKDTTKFTPLEKECRSLIMDRNTLDVVCYSFDEMLYNDDAKQHLFNMYTSDKKNKKSIEECYEGTLLAIYNYDDKWHVSTRKCLDANKSKWKSKKTHYDMFIECAGDNFFVNLDKEYYYFFVLVHYDNKNFIDYSEYFGDAMYKKLIHVMTRDKKTHLEVEGKFLNNYIPLKPKIYNDFSELDKENEIDDIRVAPKMEGVVIKFLDEETNKTLLMKIQSKRYMMLNTLKPNSINIYSSFVELYQTGYLKKHLEIFPENNKIFNPLFDEEPYDTLGVIDATFKVLTSELYELFQILWNYRDASHKNKELYKILSSEYTTILYKIRGIYYKKKEEYILKKNNNQLANKNYNLRICDIYNLLKGYDTKELLKLLHARKILKAKADAEQTDPIYASYRNVSNKCDKVSIKMIAILLNCMFEN